MKALQQIRGKLRSSWRGSRTTIVTFITKKRKAGLTLKPLQPGQLVQILDHHIKTWEPGTILREAREPQSYYGKNNTTQGIYQRTRSHLRPDTTSSCAQSPAPVQVPRAVTRPTSPFREMEPPTSTVGQPPGNSPELRPPAKIEVPPETSGRCRTRFGQTVKPPDKLNI